MDELVAQLAARTGIDPATARKAVVVILRFLQRDGKTDKVAPLIDKLPGAREAIGSGGGSSGLMGAFNDLTATGLGLGQVQSVARTFMGLAKERIGEAPVDEIINSIPGLKQFT